MIYFSGNKSCSSRRLKREKKNLLNHKGSYKFVITEVHIRMTITLHKKETSRFISSLHKIGWRFPHRSIIQIQGKRESSHWCNYFTCYHYNLFKLFFLASIFFLSALTLGNPTFSLFFITGASEEVAEPLIPVSVTVLEAAFVDWSWLPLTTVLVVGANGDGNGTAAPVAPFFCSVLRTEVLVWPTFKAVVDSEIAPFLNFGFGFIAWQSV